MLLNCFDHDELLYAAKRNRLVTSHSLQENAKGDESDDSSDGAEGLPGISDLEDSVFEHSDNDSRTETFDDNIENTDNNIEHTDDNIEHTDDNREVVSTGGSDSTDSSEDSEDGLCEDYVPNINCECMLPFNFQRIDKIMCTVCGQYQHLPCTGGPLNSEYTCYRCCVRLQRNSADVHSRYLDKPQRLFLAMTRLIGAYMKAGLSGDDIITAIPRKSRESIITAVMKCGIIVRHGKRIVPSENYEENLKKYMNKPEHPTEEAAVTITKRFRPISRKDLSISCLCELPHHIYGIETIQCGVCKKHQHAACLGFKVKPNLPHTCYSCCKRLGLQYADSQAMAQSDPQRYYLSILRLISIFMLKTGLYPEYIITAIDRKHRKTAAVLLKRNGFIKLVESRIVAAEGYKEAMRPYIYPDPKPSEAGNISQVIADTVENSSPVEISNEVP